MWRRDKNKMERERARRHGRWTTMIPVIRAAQLDCKIVMTCFFAPNPTSHLTRPLHGQPGGDHRTLGDIIADCRDREVTKQSI